MSVAKISGRNDAVLVLGVVDVLEPGINTEPKCHVEKKEINVH